MGVSTGGVIGGAAQLGKPSGISRSAGSGKNLWQRIWEERWAYVFILPKVISFVVFFAYPAIFAFYSSFFRFDNFNLMPLKGGPLYNYQRALRDPTLRRAFLNVIELFVLTFLGTQTLSLFIAVLLNGLKRFVTVFRTIYYIPVITSIVVVSTLFRWLLRSDQAGVINLVLYKLTGLGPVRWLWEEWLVIPAIAFVSVWTGLGWSIIIWTAGLKGIPREFYEAAVVDGATRWQQFWGITLPMLKPIILYQVVMGLIGGMRAFGYNFTMTNGGPGVASMTPVLMIYNYGWLRMQQGYASAVAYVLAVVILLMTIVQFRLFGSFETYD
jgi:ABC-type sugar transport system permease subunit